MLLPVLGLVLIFILGGWSLRRLWRIKEIPVHRKIMVSIPMCMSMGGFLVLFLSLLFLPHPSNEEIMVRFFTIIGVTIAAEGICLLLFAPAMSAAQTIISKSATGVWARMAKSGWLGKAPTPTSLRFMGAVMIAFGLYAAMGGFL